MTILTLLSQLIGILILLILGLPLGTMAVSIRYMLLFLRTKHHIPGKRKVRNILWSTLILYFFILGIYLLINTVVKENGFSGLLLIVGLATIFLLSCYGLKTLNNFHPARYRKLNVGDDFFSNAGLGGLTSVFFYMPIILTMNGSVDAAGAGAYLFGIILAVPVTFFEGAFFGVLMPRFFIKNNPPHRRSDEENRTH